MEEKPQERSSGPFSFMQESVKIVKKRDVKDIIWEKLNTPFYYILCLPSLIFFIPVLVGLVPTLFVYGLLIFSWAFLGSTGTEGALLKSSGISDILKPIISALLLVNTVLAIPVYVVTLFFIAIQVGKSYEDILQHRFFKNISGYYRRILDTCKHVLAYKKRYWFVVFVFFFILGMQYHYIAAVSVIITGFEPPFPLMKPISWFFVLPHLFDLLILSIVKEGVNLTLLSNILFITPEGCFVRGAPHEGVFPLSRLVRGVKSR
ncbi:hypothetical protein GF319_03240 [Candidatus Bathyarchaeota archaeon]|nr:hypothetical protein [Candidatus Bathyarchaeota archaeon]